MKNEITFKSLVAALLGLFMVLALPTNSFAQEKKAKKEKVRLKVSYTRNMDTGVSFEISAGAKVDNKSIDVANIELTAYNIFNDEEVELGKVVTDAYGKGVFTLDSMDKLQSDSSGVYNVNFAFNGNDKFSKANKDVTFMAAIIESELYEVDSVYYIKAYLKDALTNEPIVDENLFIRLQRMFKPMKIGDQFTNTDENGMVELEISTDFPGRDGILNYEVVLSENETYGTVIDVVSDKIGKVMVEETAFDERTMFSPANKTPINMLIWPNLLILGVWLTIFYLVFNLVKIKKSN